MKIEKLNIPVNFDLSFLKIRWSDRILVKDRSKVVGEGVVYGGDWQKAERLAKQMVEMKFAAKRGNLPICEQVFINSINNQQLAINNIVKRHSNLKVKVGRNVFDDIKTLEYIKNILKFPNKIRLDANQGYSLKQLQYLIPTLKQLGVVYVEEPVKVKALPAAADLLHGYGLKIILDETLSKNNTFSSVIPDFASGEDQESIQVIFDAINIKLSRVGDINKALDLIKLAKKHNIEVIIGCSEELERGMEAIYALGHEAKRAGVLLEVEGFGPKRLAKFIHNKALNTPRLINKAENLILICRHKLDQTVFDLWWELARIPVLLLKQSKKLSSLSLRLVELTGKYPGRVHPKHLVITNEEPEYIKWVKPIDKVLDIGCGNGQHSLRLAPKVKEVIGFDVDEVQLKLARQAARRLKIKNIRFENTSATEKLPYKSDQFNCVLFLGVLEHLANRNMVLNEVWRVLKPAGKLLLGVPNEMTSWKKTQMKFGIPHYTDPDHKIEFTKETITRLLEDHKFKVASLLPTAYDTPWAGFIDLIGGISLKWYRKSLERKWKMVKSFPEETISFFIVATKDSHSERRNVHFRRRRNVTSRSRGI